MMHFRYADNPHYAENTAGGRNLIWSHEWVKNGLEAFSDGVIASISSYGAEPKVPHGATFDVLVPLWPMFMSYVRSFIYVGIYWNKLQYANHPVVRFRRVTKRGAYEQPWG